MMDALWHAAFLAANLWGANSADQIPFVNRLHRTVGYAEESQEIAAQTPGTRVVACWENRGDSLVGSVYVFCEESKRPVAAVGRIEVQAFDMAPALKGEEPLLLAQWTFHPDMLEKLQRKDLIGDGYTLTVNWADVPAKVENIKLQTVYVPTQGASRSDEPTYVARRAEDDDTLKPIDLPGPALISRRETDAALMRRIQTQPEPKSVPALSVSREGSKASDAGVPTPSAVADIVRMNKAGLSKEIVFRQAAIDNILNSMPADDVAKVKAAVKSIGVTVLTVDDLINLKGMGIPDELIMEFHSSYISQIGRIVPRGSRESN